MTLEGATLGIECQFVSEAVDPAAPLRDRLLSAMRESLHGTRNMGWATDEEDKFRVAVGAVLLKATPEERKEIEAEVAGMRKVAAVLNALRCGVPVDTEKLEAGPGPTIGLRQLWEEAKRG